MCRIVALVGLVCLCCNFTLSASDQPSDRMFERLKSLVGSWEGTYEWSTGRTGSGKLKATYSLAGNGSALVENLIMGDTSIPTMTTVYHLDGSDLRMTHYCAAKNQPRLKSSHIDESAAAIDFVFVDVTNASAAPAYVNGFHIEFPEKDRLNLRFIFGGGTGNGAVENIVLQRVSAAPDQRKHG